MTSRLLYRYLPNIQLYCIYCIYCIFTDSHTFFIEAQFATNFTKMHKFHYLILQMRNIEYKSQVLRFSSYNVHSRMKMSNMKTINF